MTKPSPKYLSLADELISQYALIQDDHLFDILTRENLEHFQSQYSGDRVRDFPPLKTLSLFILNSAVEFHKLLFYLAVVLLAPFYIIPFR